MLFGTCRRMGTIMLYFIGRRLRTRYDFSAINWQHKLRAMLIADFKAYQSDLGLQASY